MRNRYPFEMYPTFVHHQHEHGMTGSIAVDPQRAVAAFTLGLAAIDALTEKYADKIATEEKAIAQLEAERESRWNVRQEKLDKERGARDAARSLVRELKAKESFSFWGLNSEDKARLAKAKEAADQYVDSLGAFSLPRFSYGPQPREQIADLKASVETQLAQCAVALDCSHLTPGWAANVYRMEQGDWAEKQYPFNRYAKGE